MINMVMIAVSFCFILAFYFQALNEGELSSHKLDEMWSSFGAELTEVKDRT